MITANRKALALLPAFLGLAIGIQGCAITPQDETDSTSADAVSGAVGNWSGMTAGQCVHGVYSFYANRFGIALEGTGAQGGNIGNCEFEGACMIWESARVEPTEVASTKSKFNKYAWGTTMPQTYDIVVYPPRTAGLGPGHVAAVDHMASSNPAAWEQLYVMDSNYYGGERLATAVHTVSRAPYGIFRLKSLDHAPAKPTDVAPKGQIDSTACTGVAGWAQDTTAPTASIFTDVYFNGAAGSPSATGVRLTADASRADLCTALGSCDHAWSMAIPRSQLTDTPHAVYAYGIDTTGGTNTELVNSGKTFSCAAPAIDASTTVKRLIKTTDITASWKFSTFYDSAPYTSDALASVKDGSDFIATPEIVQMAGDPDLYVVDGNSARKIASMGSFAAWRFTTAMIQTISKSAFDAYTEGLGWPVTPLLANDTDGQVTNYYVLDDSIPIPISVDAGAAPPSSLASDRGVTSIATPYGLATGSTSTSGADPNAAGDDPGGAPATENGDNASESSSGCSVTHHATSRDDAIWALLPLAGLFLRRRRNRSSKI
jgi:MYXO-CTERM domain-containing protein